MRRTSGTPLAFVAMLFLLGTSTAAHARDWYVSVANGKGKSATKEKPAKDLGNIASQVQTGDVIHIAGGVYLGRGKNGSTTVNGGVTIIGGYDEAFEKRDPWGATKTILTGENPGVYTQTDLLRVYCKRDEKVIVDGVIFDNGPRNRFKTDKQLLILRKAGDGKNPTPESGGLRVEGGCDMEIKNNVVLNVAASGGAMSLWGGEGSKIEVTNNLVVNNTGEGIFAFSKYHPRRDAKNPVLPMFHIHHNTVLFSWKHDAIATYGGNAIKVDTDIVLQANNNVLGFSDYGGVDNIKKSANMLIKENLFFANKLYDYREFNTEMRVDVLEDEAELLHADSTDNLSTETAKVNVGERYAGIYANRVDISRESVDNAAKVQGGAGNALRGMLGLPLQASAVKMDADIWLPLITVDEAIGAGLAPYSEKYGCKKP